MKWFGSSLRLSFPPDAETAFIGDVVLWNFPLTGAGEAREVALRFPANNAGPVRVMRLNPENPFNQLELERSGTVAGLEGGAVRFSLRPYEIRWVALSQAE